jgi:hypothetical protein
MADFLIVLGAITLVLLIGFVGAWIGVWLTKLTERVADMLSDRSGRIGHMAEPKEKVYVLSFEIDQGSGDYAGWTSVHRSREGAEKRFQEKLDEWELREQYEADELEYSISVLDLED